MTVAVVVLAVLVVLAYALIGYVLRELRRARDEAAATELCVHSLDVRLREALNNRGHPRRIA